MKTILAMGVAVLLVGCGDGITPHNYEQAVKACAPNGGLDYVYKDINKHAPTATCNNGVRIIRLPVAPRN